MCGTLQKHVQNITSRQLLSSAIRNKWTDIPIDYIQDLYKSISKRRIQDLYKSISKRRKQVIKAEGKWIYFLSILLQRFEIPGVVHLKLAAILKLSSLLV